MSNLPAGVVYRDFGDQTSLATRGPPVYGERTAEGWREWDPTRSKLGAVFEMGHDVGLAGGDTVLYLGAAAGTTVSHVADFAGPTYAVEFAPRPMRELLSVAADRPTLFPLLKDARKPETYAHIVEANVDAIVQDVATRGQASVAIQNKRFLAADGRLVLMLKTRSESVTETPAAVFETAREQLQAEYTIVETTELEPFHEDHYCILAEPR